MPAKIPADKAVKDASGIEKVWKANPEMKLGTNGDAVTLEIYQAAIKAVTDVDDQIEAVNDQLDGLRNQRDDAAKVLNGYNTRALSAVRGIFGPDSSEYELAGGTRSSERKSAKRAAKPVPA